MIPRYGESLQTQKQKTGWPDWKKELATAIRDPHELLKMLNLDPDAFSADYDINSPFPLRVTHDFISRMKPGDPKDPLLLQVMPLNKERLAVTGYLSDPVGDLDAQLTPGALKKYNGRALLIATGACGIHCRYCFRRHFPYAQSVSSESKQDNIFAKLHNDRSIDEVILSGGDPLCLADERLESMLYLLDNIAHIRRIRIHSRMPVVLPNRINERLINTLSAMKKNCIFVIHANHANEISGTVKQSLFKLHKAGVTLLNQSVLLHDINDSVQALQALSEILGDHHVMPYYLHMLDKVQGASHFDVPLDRARAIITGLRSKLPGYLVPLLVREQAGMAFKTPVETTYS